MSVVLLIIIGIAAGFLATRLMGLQPDVPTTIAIGVAGVFVGGFAVRGLVMLGGFMAGFVGAVIGAIVLIWLWNTYVR